MSMNSKIFKFLIIISIFFISGLSSQIIILYGFQTIENTVVTEIVPHPFDGYNQSFSREIQIVKPINTQASKLPVVILLHGDAPSNSHAFNYLKLEFLRNQYLVVLIEVEDYYEHLPDLFFELNAALDYLLEREDVNTSQIGIAGHSHGAHIALLFGCIRNDSIKSVICANFGYMNLFYYDYYLYYRNYILHDDSLSEYYDIFSNEGNTFNLPMSLTNPNNLLLLSDETDNRPNLPLEDYLFDFTGVYNQRNKLYGNFQDGSARKLFVTNSYQGHGSGVSNPEAICEEISWMNQALGVECSNNDINLISFNLFLLPFLVYSTLGVGIALAGAILLLLPKQDKLFQKLYDKIKNKQKTNPKKKKNENDNQNSQFGNLDDQRNKIKRQGKRKGDSEQKEPSSQLTDINYKSKKYIKILIFTLISVDIGLIIFYIIESFISNDHVGVYVTVETPYDILGFSSYYLSKYLNDYFPLQNMIFWSIIIIILECFIMNKIDSTKNGLDNNLKQNFIYSIVVALEAYIIIYFLFKLSFFFYTGDGMSSISISNPILACFFLYSANQIAFKVQTHLAKEPRILLKLIAINLLIFFLFFIPTIIREFIIRPDYLYYANFLLFEHIIIIISLSLLNVLLHNIGKYHFISIAFLDYLILNFLYSYIVFY